MRRHSRAGGPRHLREAIRRRGGGIGWEMGLLRGRGGSPGWEPLLGWGARGGLRPQAD